MTGARLDLHSALRERGALLKGHFRLSSGRHSDRFVQKFRILEDPALLEPVALAIAQQFRSVKPTVVVGAAVGGILLGYEIARQLGVKAIFVEKENSLPVLRRGFSLSAADRALVVEDVVTTGLSVREVIEVVRHHGALIAGIGVVVVRGVDLSDLAQDEKVPTFALLDLPLVSYEESECPQCRAGEPVSDPGSRRS
ncbi:MAG: orotate phosphoribosyltransferase [Candidatus Cybelea sp.]|jgi:orotate phosphoribosyltransferase